MNTEHSPSLKDAPLLLPWHQPLARQIEAAWPHQRLPHALLLHGPAGLGKRRFATWLAQALLCQTQRSTPDTCGNCPGCRLLAADSHPDLTVILPEEGKQQISVDQVRALSGWLAMTSHQQGWKIAIVDPAQQMTVGAANSLLKTLEEPPPRSLLILVATTLQGMPATVRSRCQRLAMPWPSRDIALRWLQEATGRSVTPQLLEFASGAPLKALQQAEGAFMTLDEEMRSSLEDFLAGRTDVTRVAQFWAKENLHDRLTWLDLWLMSLARGAVVGTADLVTFPEQGVPLPSPAIPLNISRLYRLADRARELKGQLARTALNRELAVESLLIELTRVLPRH